MNFIRNLLLLLVLAVGMSSAVRAECGGDLESRHDDSIEGTATGPEEAVLKRRYAEFSRSKHSELLTVLGEKLYAGVLAGKNVALMDNVSGFFAQVSSLEKKMAHEGRIESAVNRIADTAVSKLSFVGPGSLKNLWLVSDMLLFLTIVPEEKLTDWHYAFFGGALTDLSEQQRADFASLLEMAFNRFDRKRNNLFEVFEALRLAA